MTAARVRPSSAPPEITVLVVTHNHEAFIARALASVSAQVTGRSVEVIISDDDSSDGTLEIVRAWSASTVLPVRVLPATARLGIAKNYRRAFAECRGAKVAVLEGDDEWIASDKLELQARALDEDPGLSMVAGRVLRYDESTRRSHVGPLIAQDGRRQRLTSRELANGNWFSTFSACMYRTSALRAVHSEVFELQGYDWVMNLAVTEHGDSLLLPQVMTLYRQHTTATWSGRAERDKDAALRAALDGYIEVLGDRVGVELQRIIGTVQHRLTHGAYPEPAASVAPTRRRIPRITRADPPVASIVVRSRNDADGVVSAIGSLLSVESDVEVIVVDDASDDGTLDALATIDDPRLRVYALAEVVGVAAALNIAMQQARAEIVVVASGAAPAWSAREIDAQVSLLLRRPELGAVVIATDPSTQQFSSGDWLRRMFERWSIGWHDAPVAVTASALEQVGLFDRRLSHLALDDLWLRVLKGFPIEVLPGNPRQPLPPDATAAGTAAREWERSLINERFFTGCGDALMLDGFQRFFIDRTVHTGDEFNCELALLWLNHPAEPAAPNRRQGIRELERLVSIPAASILLWTRYGVRAQDLSDLAIEVPHADSGRRGLLHVLDRARRTPLRHWPKAVAGRLRGTARRVVPCAPAGSR